MNIAAKFINFIKEVNVQLAKVSWPTKQELIGATTVVIMTTLILAVFVGVIDLVFSRLLSWAFR